MKRCLGPFHQELGDLEKAGFYYDRRAMSSQLSVPPCRASPLLSPSKSVVRRLMRYVRCRNTRAVRRYINVLTSDSSGKLD